MKWPKSSCKKEWATVNADLSKIMDAICRTVEKKLVKMSGLIYFCGAERSVTKEPKKKEMPTPPKSRRQ